MFSQLLIIIWMFSLLCFVGAEISVHVNPSADNNAWTWIARIGFLIISALVGANI